jgi:acyl-CoA dehydrogenase
MSELALPLSEAAERLFSQRCDSRVVAAADDGDWPLDLWMEAEDLGPNQLLVPESLGGAGGDWVDACALLERAAAHSAPLPLAETLLAGWLRGCAGAAAAAGPGCVAFADLSLAAMREDGRASLALSGIRWTPHASHLAVVGSDDSGMAQLLWLPRGETTIEADDFAKAPASVTCLDVPLKPVVSASADDAWCVALPGIRAAEVRARAALLTAAQIAGALGHLLQLTLAYTSERVQFGRAIGQFQAVQHQLAQLAEEAAAARVASRAAAATVDSHWFIVAAAAAKIRAGEAAGLGSRIAHQLHGAIGVTAEHTLHHSTRRLRQWRDEHGGEAFWARALVEALRGRGEQSAWQATVACTSR